MALHAKRNNSKAYIIRQIILPTLDGIFSYLIQLLLSQYSGYYRLRGGTCTSSSLPCERSPG